MIDLAHRGELSDVAGLYDSIVTTEPTLILKTKSQGRLVILQRQSCQAVVDDWINSIIDEPVVHFFTGLSD